MTAHITTLFKYGFLEGPILKTMASHSSAMTSIFASRVVGGRKSCVSKHLKCEVSNNERAARAQLSVLAYLGPSDLQNERPTHAAICSGTIEPCADGKIQHA